MFSILIRIKYGFYYYYYFNESQGKTGCHGLPVNILGAGENFFSKGSFFAINDS